MPMPRATRFRTTASDFARYELDPYLHLLACRRTGPLHERLSPPAEAPVLTGRDTAANHLQRFEVAPSVAPSALAAADGRQTRSVPAKKITRSGSRPKGHFFWRAGMGLRPAKWHEKLEIIAGFSTLTRG
jgi:hypothetical protein